MHRGFAKLYRKFLEWEWYDDIPCKVLYLHCLLKANHKEKEYRGVAVDRGTFLTSYAVLSKQTGLTVKQVRVAASKLEGKYLASKRTNKGQAVSVIDFERYNGTGAAEGTQDGTQRARRGHAEGTQRATTKNVKECLKNEKNTIARSVFCTEFEKQVFDSLQPHFGERLSILNSKTYQRLVANLSRENYPGVDIPEQIRKAGVWEDSNPTRNKTGRGLPKFLTGWMDRAQNRSGMFINQQNSSSRVVPQIKASERMVPIAEQD